MATRREPLAPRNRTPRNASRLHRSTTASRAARWGPEAEPPSASKRGARAQEEQENTVPARQPRGRPASGKKAAEATAQRKGRQELQQEVDALKALVDAKNRELAGMRQSLQAEIGLDPLHGGAPDAPPLQPLEAWRLRAHQWRKQVFEASGPLQRGQLSPTDFRRQRFLNAAAVPAAGSVGALHASVIDANPCFHRASSTNSASPESDSADGEGDAGDDAGGRPSASRKRPRSRSRRRPGLDVPSPDPGRAVDGSKTLSPAARRFLRTLRHLKEAQGDFDEANDQTEVELQYLNSEMSQLATLSAWTTATMGGLVDEAASARRRRRPEERKPSDAVHARDRAKKGLFGGSTRRQRLARKAAVKDAKRKASSGTKQAKYDELRATALAKAEAKKAGKKRKIEGAKRNSPAQETSAFAGGMKPPGRSETGPIFASGQMVSALSSLRKADAKAVRSHHSSPESAHGAHTFLL